MEAPEGSSWPFAPATSNHWLLEVSLSRVRIRHGHQYADLFPNQPRLASGLTPPHARPVRPTLGARSFDERTQMEPLHLLRASIDHRVEEPLNIYPAPKDLHNVHLRRARSLDEANLVRGRSLFEANLRRP